MFTVRFWPLSFLNHTSSYFKNTYCGYTSKYSCVCVCTDLTMGHFCRYQQMLHRNLVYLATIADSNQNMQSLLPAVSMLLAFCVTYFTFTLQSLMFPIFQLFLNVLHLRVLDPHTRMVKKSIFCICNGVTTIVFQVNPMTAASPTFCSQRLQ